MKGTSVRIKNMRIKQLCNRKVQDFAMALNTRKFSGAFEKQALGHYRAIGDQVNMAPKLEPPLKRRHIWPQTAGIL